MQADTLAKKIDEMFLHNIETASSDRELVESINAIRFDRFDTALREMLMVAKDSEPEPGRRSEEDLKAHVMEMLGSSYMQLHSVGYGPSLHPDDATAALKAYWRACYTKLNEDVAAAIEVLLLQKCSEMIERDLLLKMQLWLSDSKELEAVLSVES